MDFSSAGTKQATKDSPGGYSISVGIEQMNFVRGKGTPDAKCTFTVIGRPPREAIAGTWVVINSYQSKKNNDPSDNNLKKPRFIGQITTLSTTYNTDPESGLVSQSTVYQVREWSHSLTVPVRLDLLAFANTVSAGLPKIVAATKDKADGSVIAELVKQSLNPFQTAALILVVIGALQDNDKPNGIDVKSLEKYKEVAVKMQSVPQSLLDRLGIKAKPSGAFTSGFLKTIIGVQTAPMLNDGNWDGVFSKSSMTLDSFQSKFNRDPSDRPAVLSASAILQAGVSAWQLLQSFCDPSLNEYYTDFVHELKSDNTIGARPILMMRDKPFSMKHVERNILTQTDPDAPSKVSSFSKYDNIPRIHIPSVNISRFSFTNTIINSPNFIRINFNDQGGNKQLAQSVANSRGPIRLEDEINRFGGYELSVESNFLGYNDGSKPPTSGGVGGAVGNLVESANKLKNIVENVNTTVQAVKGGSASDIINITEKYDFVKWADKMKLITQSWNSYDYRTGTGTLVLKDDNFSLTCGFNAQFQIGNFTLVGHIEVVSASVVVDGSGTYITETQVQLSRIVMAPNGNVAPLEFINPESFCYMIEDNSPPPTPSGGGLKNQIISGAKGKALNAVKGLLS